VVTINLVLLTTGLLLGNLAIRRLRLRLERLEQRYMNHRHLTGERAGLTGWPVDKAK
jgi:hypothetical protein